MNQNMVFEHTFSQTSTMAFDNISIEAHSNQFLPAIYPTAVFHIRVFNFNLLNAVPGHNSFHFG